MKFTYCQETDSLYIEFLDKPGADTKIIASGFVMDIDEMGNPVGLDIANASKRMDLSKMEIVPIIRALEEKV